MLLPGLRRAIGRTRDGRVSGFFNLRSSVARIEFRGYVRLAFVVLVDAILPRSLLSCLPILFELPLARHANDDFSSQIAFDDRYLLFRLDSDESALVSFLLLPGARLLLQGRPCAHEISLPPDFSPKVIGLEGFFLNFLAFFCAVLVRRRAAFLRRRADVAWCSELPALRVSLTALPKTFFSDETFSV